MVYNRTTMLNIDSVKDELLKIKKSISGNIANNLKDSWSGSNEAIEFSDKLENIAIDIKKLIELFDKLYVCWENYNNIQNEKNKNV